MVLSAESSVAPVVGLLELHRARQAGQTQQDKVMQPMNKGSMHSTQQHVTEESSSIARSQLA
jgi:hypothetical protein